MKGAEIRDRLKNFVEKERGKKANTDAEKGKQAAALGKLENLLQNNMERQQQVLQRVMDKAPADAKAAIQQAMEKARQGWQQAKDSLGKAKVTPTATPTPQGNSQ